MFGLVVPSARGQNMQSGGRHLLHLQPIIYCICDPAVSLRGCRDGVKSYLRSANSNLSLFDIVGSTNMLFDDSGKYP